ncbi:MAG TPA: hypothetical protein VIY08_04810 [Candidatus Nitrosocosmicus sp.]
MIPIIKNEQEKIEKQKQSKPLSPYARAFQMFQDGLPLIDIAVDACNLHLIS